MAQQSAYSVVKGLSENECKFIGRVAEDPYITERMAIIKLNTIAAEMGQNKQLVDTIQVVPVTVLDPAKIDGIKKYVKKGKQLLVTAYYKSWDNGNRHALVATKIKYGPDEYKPQNKGGNQQGGNQQGGAGQGSGDPLDDIPFGS